MEASHRADIFLGWDY